MAALVDDTPAEGEQKGAVLWRCADCGYVNLDHAACELCGSTAPPGIGPVAAHPVADERLPDAVVGQGAAAGEAPVSEPAGPAASRRRVRWVVAGLVIVAALLGLALVLAGRRPSGTAVAIPGLALRLPAGWHRLPTPPGRDLVATGPDGARIEVWHSDGAAAPDLQALARALRDGDVRPLGATVDPGSVRLTSLTIGRGVRAAATVSGHRVDAVATAVGSRSYSFELLGAGPGPESAFESLLSSVRLLGPPSG